MNKIFRIVIKYVLLGFLVFSFTTCLIIFKKNYELNKNNRECLSLIDEIEEYQKVIAELETINNEGLSRQDKINKLNERVDSLNQQIDDYKNNISRLNTELGIK